MKLVSASMGGAHVAAANKEDAYFLGALGGHVRLIHEVLSTTGGRLGGAAP